MNAVDMTQTSAFAFDNGKSPSRVTSSIVWTRKTEIWSFNALVNMSCLQTYTSSLWLVTISLREAGSLTTRHIHDFIKIQGNASRKWFCFKYHTDPVYPPPCHRGLCLFYRLFLGCYSAELASIMLPMEIPVRTTRSSCTVFISKPDKLYISFNRLFVLRLSKLLMLNDLSAGIIHILPTFNPLCLKSTNLFYPQ